MLWDMLRDRILYLNLVMWHESSCFEDLVPLSGVAAPKSAVCHPPYGLHCYSYFIVRYLSSDFRLSCFNVRRDK
jgi:hypothetical protein